MHIFSIDGAFYRFLEKLTSLLLLNLLWIVMCLPIITIFPATAAMFAVVRQWVQKNEIGVFKGFFSYFKENFLQSFGMGLLWLVFAILYYLNFNIVLQMSGMAKIIMISFLLFVGLFFVMTSVFLLPVMVHYQVRLLDLIKNSSLLSISQLWVTIRCMIVLSVTALISFFIPILSIIIWSFAVYIIYALCHKSFLKVESIVQEM